MAKVGGLEKWGDDVVICPLSNGNTMYYVIKCETAIEVGIYLKDEERLEVFDNVDDKLISIILQYRGSDNERLRFFYGDRKTGRSWNEEFDVSGYVGRSCGNLKIPILLNKKNSCYGGALSLGSIIRVDEISSHRTLWKVSNFHVEEMKVMLNKSLKDYPFSVMRKKDGSDFFDDNIANFKTEVQAKRYIAFLKGERYNK